MAKRFKQVSTGLTLVCEREDVIKQYEKYPEAYIPLDKAESAPKTTEKIYSKNIEASGSIYANGREIVMSHVGQIIMTTILNTAAKVADIYGGTWVAWGAVRVPIGIGSNGTTNYPTVESTGGEEKHTLSVSEIPSHSHTIRSGWSENSPGNDAYRYQFWGKNDLSWKGGNLGTGSTGGGGAHNNLQPYTTVYMWKRTA